jgi:hypothetical protein
VPVDVDVVVEPDPAGSPFGILVGLGRQLLQRRTVQLQKQVAPADAKARIGRALRSATSSQIVRFSCNS